MLAPADQIIHQHPSHDNPICDSRYWGLLADILGNSNAEKTDDRGRALRAWLIPLLNRIPIAPILLSYLELLSTSAQIDPSQSTLALKCIAILWPLAVPKVNPETLLECFGAVIQLGVSPDVSGLSCGRVLALEGLPALSAIVSSYRAFLANAAAKRKVRNCQLLFPVKLVHSCPHLAAAVWPLPQTELCLLASCNFVELRRRSWNPVACI